MSDIHTRFQNVSIMEKLLALHSEAKAGRVNVDYVEGLSLEAAEEIKNLRFKTETLERLVKEYLRWTVAPTIQMQQPRSDSNEKI